MLGRCQVQTGRVWYSVSNGGTAKQSVVQLRLGAQHIPSPVKPRVGLVHQMWASSSSIQFIGQLFISKPFEFRDELLIF